ncbi:MAG: molybdopterin-dependent oxidoreductase [Chloroflexota bacterium]
MNEVNTQHRPPSILTGALVGLVLTAPFIAVLYIADGLIGTPFVPFDVFDWLARALPGGLVTFGIDTIISIIVGLNLEDTSRTAKIAEHIMALLLILSIGALLGILLFAVMRRMKNPGLLPGLFAGAILGTPAAILSATFNQSASADPLLSIAWILLAFLVWGAAYSWAFNRLNRLPHPDEPAVVTPLDRRRFLITLGSATAAITVVGAGLGTLLGAGDAEIDSEAVVEHPWSGSHALPNADAVLQPAPGTRAEFTPRDKHYRVDINSLPPVIREDSWTLQVVGLVGKPLSLTLDDIRNNYTPLDQFITLSCISNGVGGDLIGTQRWTGVPLKKIIDSAMPKENASQLHITSADGFDEYIGRALVNTDERVMLTYDWDGLPLPKAHGYPLRLFIPDRYGMKQPKWIVRIELTDQEDEGYWVRRGWDPLAQVRATSVVDSIAKDATYQKDGQTFVPVGGIAFAGKRGISKVEVRVDDGEWQGAELRTSISDLTWTIWRYDWPFQAGDHIFFVRTMDGRGAKQIETESDTRPSGATGIDRKRASL